MATIEPESSDVPAARTRSTRRSMLRLALLAFLVYMTFVILLTVFQRKLIYYPTYTYEGVPTDVSLAYEDVSLSTSDGVTITGWFVPRDGATGTVLFLHGNAGNISHRLHTVHVLHQLGYSVFLIDYRGFGRSSGKPHEAGLYRDATAAWHYLTGTRGIPAERIVVVGRSLGGAVAIELATRHAPAALVVESTFTSLVDVARVHFRFFPVRLILRERYDSINRIGQVRCPVLILHGTEDQLIPIDQGRALYAAAREPKRFIQTPGGHNEAGFTYNQPFSEALKVSLDECLRP